MNWKIGQKLICVGSGKWQNDWGEKCGGPKHGEIVTYEGPAPHVGIYLEEYKGTDRGVRECWNPSLFRHLLSQSATSELISSFTEVTETSDLPIRSPQPVPSSCGS